MVENSRKRSKVTAKPSEKELEQDISIATEVTKDLKKRQQISKKTMKNFKTKSVK